MGPKKVNKQAAKRASKDAKKLKQEKKAAKKHNKQLGEGGKNDDLDAILAQIEAEEKEQETKSKTTIVNFKTEISPRAHFTAIPLSNGAEVVIFGGEYYNGTHVQVYKELFRVNLMKFGKNVDNKDTNLTKSVVNETCLELNLDYSSSSSLPNKIIDDDHNVTNNSIRQLITPKSPRPRCSHQSVFFNNCIYMFGGEFATKDSFIHYGDLWRLNCKTWLWEEVKTTGKPPSVRSGHRMVVYRGHIICFGGFHDSFREIRYFNDLYILSLKTLKWEKVTYEYNDIHPLPRSAPIFHCFESLQGAFLFGGYAKSSDKGKVYTDSWWLDLQPLAKGQKPKWEAIVKKGSYPLQRSGMSSAVYKQQLYVFGGVHDEDQFASIRSYFFNDLHCFDANRKRWYKVTIGAKKKNQNKGDTNFNESQIVNNPISDINDDNDSDKGNSDDDVDVSKKPSKFYDNSDSDHGNEFVYIDRDGKLVKMELNEADEFVQNEKDNLLEKAHKILRENNEEEVKSPIKKKKKRKKDMISENYDEEDNINNLKKDKKENDVSDLDDVNNNSQQNQPIIEAKNKGIIASDMLGTLDAEFMPCPRINAQCFFRGSTFYIWGGLVEVGKVEVTLDDVWSVDILKRNQWNQLYKGSLDTQVWLDDNDDEKDDQNNNIIDENDVVQYILHHSSSYESDDEENQNQSDSELSTALEEVRLDDNINRIDIFERKKGHIYACQTIL